MIIASNLVAIYQISIQVKQLHVGLSHIGPKEEMNLQAQTIRTKETNEI